MASRKNVHDDLAIHTDSDLHCNLDSDDLDADEPTLMVASSANDTGEYDGFKVPCGKAVLSKSTKSRTRNAIGMSDCEVSNRRKRHISEVARLTSDVSGSDSELGVASSKCSTARRGRVGAPCGSGIARAKADLRALTDEALEAEFERDLASRAFRKKPASLVLVHDSDDKLLSESRHRYDSEMLGVEELWAVAGRSSAAILEACRKSKNLKGATVKLIKESTRDLLETVEASAGRTVSDETRLLRADNSRLNRQVKNLRAELKVLRREFGKMRSPAVKISAISEVTPSCNPDVIEELRRSIFSSVGMMLNAHLRGIEDRLLPEKSLRPSLAADRRKEAAAVTAARRDTRLQGCSESLVLQTGSSSTPRQKPLSADRPPVEAVAADDRWTTVVRKGTSTRASTTAQVAKPATRQLEKSRQKKGGKKAKGKKPRKAQGGIKPQPKLPSCSSPAVLIKLQTYAADKGVTYAMVLQRAAEMVDLRDVGLEDGLRIRKSATGARLLELPKSAPEKAELLAAKLRPVLDGVADVVRPVKRIAVKLTGLDDSVQREGIEEAICHITKCSGESLQIGEIRRGNGSMGVVFARLPVDAAKLLADAGRLLVGWSSTKVKVLEQRPLRCYRCQKPGHMRAVCPSEIDRSTVCFRCGTAGHSRASCTEMLRCAVCADKGLSAGHGE